MTTPDIAAQCEKLRARKPTTSGGELANPDGPEAADTIERQAAEIERLRKVGGAFADAVTLADSLIDRAMGTDTPSSWRKALRKISEARAALTGED
jgi:hypothetical protein